MKTNRTPYARQYRYLFLPLERALAAVPQTASSPLGKRRTEVVILFGMCLLISMISAYDTLRFSISTAKRWPCASPRR